jgi:hypothetical protein
MNTIARPPLITVPLHQLRIGMAVVNKNKEIGSIVDINMHPDIPYPISVQYNYTADGFCYGVSACSSMEELNMGIELIDDHPVETNSTNEQPNSQNNGLTAKEMEAVTILVNTRNMSRAEAILMVVG